MFTVIVTVSAARLLLQNSVFFNKFLLAIVNLDHSKPITERRLEIQKSLNYRQDSHRNLSELPGTFANIILGNSIRFRTFSTVYKKFEKSELTTSKRAFTINTMGC